MFYNREQEKKFLLNILNKKSTHIHFIYGPINSGKTNLIAHILDGLPKEYMSFYNNFRRRDINCNGDFLNTLFNIDDKTKLQRVGEYVSEILKDSSDILELTTGIPIPSGIFNKLFNTTLDKGEDSFRYLENFFNSLVKRKIKPIFILDELQIIKEIANSNGDLLIEKLFNFLVGITKETHLCHCFVVSSDSVFIEHVYGNARLEGRSRFIIVDDLDKERAYKMYDHFDLKENKDFVWDTIGGKIGDMVLLSSDIQIGYSLKESLSNMMSGEVFRLKMIEARLFHKNKKECQQQMDFLFQVTKNKSVDFEPKEMFQLLQFWVDKNVLFLDPIKNIIKPQSQLIYQGIKKLIKVS